MEGERKTITVLFADIKGSMSHIEELDPEAASAIVDPALAIMAEAVNHYQGHVAQSTGDGVFALFGSPIAQEDHPLRAIYAAMRMQEELRRYSDRLRTEGKAPVEVRIGINTGEVVMRSVGKDQSHSEYLPAGHAVGLASRLQTIASTGSIALSEHTRRLVEGYFQLKSLGPIPIKGVSDPVNVYEVLGLGPLRTRLQRSASRGLVKFVGRQREMDALKHAAEQAKAGHGQIVAAMGEPGVGKSRLFFEFKATSRSGWRVLETLSVSHGKGSAYLLVIDLLHSYFKITGEDDQRTRRAKLTSVVLNLDRSLEDTLPYLIALLGIVEGADPLVGMDPQIRGRRTLEAIKRILLRESLNQPLMLIFEDLHWIDEETQALLNLLADSIGTAKILLVVNYRPEYTHNWGSKTYYTQLRLDPLGKKGADDLLTALLGDGPEVRPLKRLIIERTQGNPFFMEETVLVLFDEGALVRNGAVKTTRSLNLLKIPPTVQAILTSRIDRLPAAEKDLLQTLAVIGKEFPLTLVRAVSPVPDGELDEMLEHLQLAEFIYEQPAVGGLEYTFKHALTQEVAYNSTLVERRKALHDRIGGAIESLCQNRLDDYLIQVARHFRSGTLCEKAADYLCRAAKRSFRRSEYNQARELITSALETVDQIPRGAQRQKLEVQARLTLAEVLLQLRGPAAPEGAEHLDYVLKALPETAEPGVVWRARRLYWRHCLERAQLHRCAETAKLLLEAAEKSGSRAAQAQAHQMLGFSLTEAGEFAPGLTHSQRAAELTDIQPSSKTFPNGLTCSIHAVLAWAQFYCGYPDQAIASAERARQLGHESFNKAALDVSFAAVASIHLFRGEPEKALIVADEERRNAALHEFRAGDARSMVYHGEALVSLGRLREGIEEMLSGLAILKNARTQLSVLPHIAHLAHAYLLAGEVELAYVTIQQGLTESEDSEERGFVAEAFTIKGEIVQALEDRETEALDFFDRAVIIAHEQGGKSFELRATTSLARLLDKQGKRDEARTRLAEIYNWFTEGFNTADLRDAKALLDELKK